jgi:hypothetical protein
MSDSVSDGRLIGVAGLVESFAPQPYFVVIPAEPAGGRKGCTSRGCSETTASPGISAAIVPINRATSRIDLTWSRDLGGGDRLVSKEVKEGLAFSGHH